LVQSLVFLTPVPGGMAVGATVGGLAGWKIENMKKIRNYCSKKFQAGSPQYNKCIAAGSQAMKGKLQKAQAKIKAKAGKK